MWRMGYMNKDIERIFFTEEQIKAKVAELGRRITEAYEGKNPVFIGVLKGSFIFMSDLVRCVDLNCGIDFMVLSSYGDGSTTTGSVAVKKDIDRDIKGKDVIIVEDIVDTGTTMSFLVDYLAKREPASIAICALLDKPSRRTVDVKVKYFGFECPDEFIVGYGLDYAEGYRCLPYIGVLKPELYA